MIFFATQACFAYQRVASYGSNVYDSAAARVKFHIRYSACPHRAADSREHILWPIENGSIAAVWGVAVAIADMFSPELPLIFVNQDLLKDFFRGKELPCQTISRPNHTFPAVALVY